MKTDKSKMTKSTPEPSFSAKIKVPPRKPKNKDVRTREYLSEGEVTQLQKAAGRTGRNCHRDATLILIGFRHALRVSELVNLRWEQIDLDKGFIYINRLKGGLPSVHPLRGVELRALRKLRREHPHSNYIFVSERQAPLTARTVHHIVQRAGEEAGLPFSVHPHMLRHSAGFYLANHGHDTRAIQGYLGHSNIKNTVIYTELSPNRYKDFWRD